MELNLDKKNLQLLTKELEFIKEKNLENFEKEIENINFFSQIVIRSYFFIKESEGF